MRSNYSHILFVSATTAAALNVTYRFINISGRIILGNVFICWIDNDFSQGWTEGFFSRLLSRARMMTNWTEISSSACPRTDLKGEIKSKN